jgi:hypothetical protein
MFWPMKDQVSGRLCSEEDGDLYKSSVVAKMIMSSGCDRLDM